MNPLILPTLMKASEKLQKGSPDEAVKLLSNVLQLDPNATQGNLKEAIKYLKKASKFNPSDPGLMYNLAKVLSEARNDTDALIYHQKATALAPSNVNAWLNYSKSLATTNNFASALQAIEKALLINDQNAEAWNNKGAILKELNRYPEAIDSYRKALLINPRFSEAFYNQGIALLALKDYESAIIYFDNAIQLNPTYFSAFNNKGIALTKLMQLEDAFECYNLSLQIEPNHIETLINKAIALMNLKRFGESLQILTEVVSRQPLSLPANVNQGLAFLKLKQYKQALSSFDRAISLNKTNLEAWFNKGLALAALKELENAISAYNAAININPDYEFLPGILLSSKMQACVWDHFSNEVQKLSKLVKSGVKATIPFPFLAMTDSEILHKNAAETWINTKHPKRDELTPILKKNHGEKIRLGYFSADFRDHPVAYLAVKLFELHDKNKFEIYAFSFGANDQSEIRKRIVTTFDTFIDVQDKSDKEIAILAREIGIDIAIDLTGLTADSRPDIFAYRAAPVQINYLGYPGSMGANYMDYIIADRIIIPNEAQHFYTEKVLYLPNSYQVNDSDKKISSKVFTRLEVNLPEKGFVFCCFNNNFKITPDTFSAWMRILNTVDNSVLWLFEDNPFSTMNLRRQAEALNIDPDRLIFAKRLPLAEHLARHRLADLFLDTLPYNAHTTASDALWAGLPVLTQIGNSFAGRVAASLLHAIDLSELITHTQDEYETLAIELANNPQKLAEIKLKLQKNRETSSLFNTRLFTKDLEDIYCGLL